MSENYRVLVVYYSHSGNTRIVGQAIAKALDADVEEIVALDEKPGALQFISRGLSATSGRTAAIMAPQKDPAQYDLVVVGGPVYGMTVSSPVRTYLDQQKARFNRVAFFTTSMSHRYAATLDKMGEIAGKAPVGTLGIPGAELRSGQYQEKVAAFCAELAR